MMHKRRFSWLGGLFLVACGQARVANPDSPTPMLSGDLEPDFSLEDVNASSPTFGMSVSPRDHLEKVSGWYFGHAT